MDKARLELIAKVMNETLDVNDVTVMDTSKVDPEYCDKFSLHLGDIAYDFYWGNGEVKNHIDEVDAAIRSRVHPDIYIEPYNRTLLNVAR